MKRHSLRSTATLIMLCLFSLCLLLLSGCASIKVIEAWNKPQIPGHRYQKLMIVGIGHDESIRAMVENILVDELRKNGVTAVASHTLVKEIDSAKREDIVAAVRTSGADAVLTIRPIAKGSTSVTQDGQSWGVYGTATNYGGTILPGARTYEDAVLQTNLFDSATAELVWSATISTYDAERPARVSRDLAGVILKDLRQAGFL